ncbi:hypothetical protein SAMN04490248_11491 [Salinihabitans flavidus]|uniref:DUF6473 domain-containing protein n=1 Tax=Salinihabitans flavidus TaxID=569882 RepID=A0A1H8T829_9RHOB|nr:DUF6473 family protein [Salinihabitans flavidus]SEO87062.1 hypothetical protein SAMN04490248_11491 [Salinihabitans flavidus]
MSYEAVSDVGLDYRLCHYGKSRVRFRGPKRRAQGEYAVFIGGTETFGKFVERPFPEMVERIARVQAINLGVVNAGIDVFLNEPEVLSIARAAQVTVIQVMGAQNMSNRFYQVHPRRNDRFVTASSTMQRVFPEVDFTEFHFTRHMLGALFAEAPDRFDLIREELREAWMARMRVLIERIGGDVVLLWFAGHSPAEQWQAAEDGIGPDPIYVDRGMIEALRPGLASIIEVTASAQVLAQGTEGMRCSELDRAAARRMLNPAAHEEAAAALVQPIRALMA